MFSLQWVKEAVHMKRSQKSTDLVRVHSQVDRILPNLRGRRGVGGCFDCNRRCSCRGFRGTAAGRPPLLLRLLPGRRRPRPAVAGRPASAARRVLGVQQRRHGRRLVVLLLQQAQGLVKVAALLCCMEGWVG
jgi:hypothetical protein